MNEEQCMILDTLLFSCQIIRKYIFMVNIAW
jgi:hypothetical protein